MDRRGATAIEYALIGSMIALVIVASVQSVGTTLIPFFTLLASTLK